MLYVPNVQVKKFIKKYEITVSYVGCSIASQGINNSCWFSSDHGLILNAHNRRFPLKMNTIDHKISKTSAVHEMNCNYSQMIYKEPVEH